MHRGAQGCRRPGRPPPHTSPPASARWRPRHCWMPWTSPASEARQALARPLLRGTPPALRAAGPGCSGPRCARRDWRWSPWSPLLEPSSRPALDLPRLLLLLLLHAPPPSCPGCLPAGPLECRDPRGSPQGPRQRPPPVGSGAPRCRGWAPRSAGPPLPTLAPGPKWHPGRLPQSRGCSGLAAGAAVAAGVGAPACAPQRKNSA
mmetsp:Transcript_102781/g.321493  ORF Transcript_102781/g.321493 Transcript_102781/m.321493 type:complete len:204 (-) Transcript_102781:9-620(-)